MAHMHGDIALLQKITSKPIVHQQIGHVLLANNIMVEDLSNSLSKFLKSWICKFVIKLGEKKKLFINTN